MSYFLELYRLYGSSIFLVSLYKSGCRHTSLIRITAYIWPETITKTVGIDSHNLQEEQLTKHGSTKM